MDEGPRSWSREHSRPIFEGLGLVLVLTVKILHVLDLVLILAVLVLVSEFQSLILSRCTSIRPC